jgi:formamidopyrimidine-DNA glycosylase
MNHFLEKRPKSRIKSVLLMQDGFPGIGNWMADEILWRSRIAPFVKVHDIALGKRVDLYQAVKEVCADALEVIGDGWKRPPDSWLFNHRWADGGTCPKTNKPLIREKINGRTACWSPAWQTYH